MTKHVQCPHCGQAYALTEEQLPRYAGQDITCSECNESFLVSEDLAVTGGLETKPSTFETRPEATAGALPSMAAAFAPTSPVLRADRPEMPPPPPYAPPTAYGYAGAAAAAATPSNVAPSHAYEPPYRFIPSAAPQPVTEPNGWATAAI